MLRLNLSDTGGGVVRRRFASGGRQHLAGERLSAAQLAAMPPANRNALIENHFIAVYPKASTGGERHVVNRGFGKFDVVEGRKLNDEPLTKEQAEKLASKDNGL